jgi:hypothetical protein
MAPKFVLAFLVCALFLASCLSLSAAATALPTTTFLSPATFTPSPLPPTPTPTPTPDPRVDWNGEWTIYLNGNSNEWGGTAVFQVDEDRITGEFTIYDQEDGTLIYRVSGSLDADGTIASGAWELWKPKQGGSGIFRWQLVDADHDQFRGNLNAGQFWFCGWRGDAKAPTPCRWS